MIVFNYEILDQFLLALDRNMSNEVFSQYIEPQNSDSEIATGSHKLILQFLGKPDPSNVHLVALHQCILKIRAAHEKEEIIARLKGAFEKAGNVVFNQGFISEIFHSIS